MTEPARMGGGGQYRGGVIPIYYKHTAQREEEPMVVVPYVASLSLASELSCDL